MTKAHLIKTIETKVQPVNQKEIDAVLAAFADVVTETLSKDKTEKVSLPGLGTFKVKDVPERTGIVQMGENKGSTWTKPAHSEITFKISKNVKELS